MSGHFLFNAAARFAERTALVDAGGSYTYGELMSRALQVSSALLQAHKDLCQQRIAFLVRPGFDYVSVQWGIWLAGGIATPLAMQHPTPELEYVIDDACATGLVVEPGLRERLSPIAEARSLRLTTTEACWAAVPCASPVALTAERGAMILYTSGSTGRPKGVLSTHGNLQAQVEVLIDAWKWQPADRILHVLPLHHVHGIINVLSCALGAGASCEFVESFDAARIWDRFAAGDLTLFMAVPTIYAKLIACWEAASAEAQQRWSTGAGRMRLMVSGSAALPVPTLEKWERITGHRLLERYGMTEIGMALSNPLAGQRRAGFVGAPLPGVEIRRVDELGRVIGEDQTPGEIEVRGPAVFREYWRRPSATREAFHDGWFRTGDIAVVDHGAYRILGRNSVDIIKTGGYKVSALEIEEVLRTHPQIRDCAVVGVADAQWGQRVGVCVVRANDASLGLEQLRAWRKQQMAAYKVPTLLRVCEELPRNAMGKVQKPVICELFEASSDSS